MTFSRLLAATALTGLALLGAQRPAPVAHIHLPPPLSIPAHGSANAVFTVTVDSGYHIQSNHPKLDYLIPSEITLTPADGLTVTSVTWPATVSRKFSFAPDAPLAVFEGSVKVDVRLQAGTAKPGPHTLQGIFRSQACNDQACHPPVSEPFTLRVIVR